MTPQTEPDTQAISQAFSDDAPDLTLWARKEMAEDNTPQLVFELASRKSVAGIIFKTYDPQPLLENDLRGFFEEYLRSVENLSADSNGRVQNAEQMVKDQGSNLFEILLPSELRQDLLALKDHEDVNSLCIVSEPLWIPWELLKFPQGKFFVEQFELTRGLESIPQKHYSPIHDLALITCQGDELEDEFKKERGALLEILDGPAVVHSIDGDFQEVRKAFGEDTFEAVHFIGHSNTGQTGGWSLQLNDGLLRIDSVETALANRNRPHAMVFLNSCNAGQITYSLTRTYGWASSFLKAGAGVFVGTQWDIESDKAKVFAEAFYKHLLLGASLGSSAQKARQELKRKFPGDPTWLAYVIYGHPSTAFFKLTAPTSQLVLANSALESIAPTKLVKPLKHYARPAVLLLFLAILTTAILYYWMKPDLRTRVAVIGFEHSAASLESNWIEMGLSEILYSSLTIDRQLIAVDPERMSQVRTDLSLPVGAPLAAEEMYRLMAHLEADYVVGGTYAYSDPPNNTSLDVSIFIQDTSSGKIRSQWNLERQEDKLFKLVSELGAELRKELRKRQLSPEEEALVRVLFPNKLETLQLYFSGLRSLRTLDAMTAHQSLSQAAEFEKEHPLPHKELAAALLELDEIEKAIEEAQEAVRLASDAKLPNQIQLEIKVRADEIAGEWQGVLEGYQTLYREYYPDDVEYGLRLLSAQVYSNQLEGVESTLESLEKLQISQRSRSRRDFLVAQAEYDLGNYDRALKLALTSASSARHLEAYYLATQATLLQVNLLDQNGDLPAATFVARKALDLAEKAESYTSVEDAFLLTAVLYVRQGELTEARNLLQELRERYEEQAGELAINLSIVLADEGRFRDARDLLVGEMEELEQVVPPAGLAIAHLGLGTAHQELGDLEPAKVQYETALALFEELGNNAGAAAAHTNLGEIFFLQSDLEEAYDSHHRALRLQVDRSAAAYDRFRLAKVALVRGQESIAREELVRALDYLKDRESAEERLWAGKVRLGMAELELQQHNFGEAARLAEEAESSFWELSARDDAILAKTFVGLAYLERGKIKDAVKISRLASAYAGPQTVTERKHAGSESWLVSFYTTLLDAGVDGAMGKADTAIEKLEEISIDAQERGFKLQAQKSRRLLRQIKSDLSREAA